MLKLENGIAASLALHPWNHAPRELPAADFETLLPSVFRDDEWKLFLVGGVLGLAIGIGQVYAFQALGM